jgi:uncharacterized iron-regulated protein
MCFDSASAAHRWFALTGCVLLAACASSAALAPDAPAHSASEPARAWQSGLDREHALVGRIWDVSAESFVTATELVQRLATARLVLLGEQHDNPDHHALQAQVIDALVARGRKPALVFEMLDVSAQPTIDRVRAERPGDVDAIAAAVAWDESGWPSWVLYRPVFAAAVRAGLPIVAAGLGPEVSMQLARKGAAALDPELARRFGLAQPLAPELHAALRAEMRDAHCGLLPDAMLDAMVLVQRARDARLAERMHAAAAVADGAVLIAGNGHVRTDRGVPAALARAFGVGATALALHEVRAGANAASDYAAAWDSPRLPFDHVWFTPRISDADHCDELRKHSAP